MIASPSAAPSDANRASRVLVEGNDSNRRTFGLRGVIDGRSRLYKTRRATPHLGRDTGGDVDVVRGRRVLNQDVLSLAGLQHNLCDHLSCDLLLLCKGAF